MSELSGLVRDLCPDGVEYRTLGEIATDIFRGNGIKRDEVTENGTPCVRYGEIYTTYGIWFDSCVSHTDESTIKNKRYFEHGDILFAITGENVEEIAKSCAYVGHEKCLAGGDIVVLKHNQNPKYLSYALATTDAQRQKSKGKVKSKVVHSSVPAISELVVPIPPLAVQEKIVEILDTFTELTAELTDELAAELAARKKQYAYYRDRLLDFGTPERPKDGVEFRPLEEIFVMRNGYTPSKANKDFWTNGTIPWFRMDDIRTNGRILSDSIQHVTPAAVKNGKLFPANSIIMATTATIGEHALIIADSLANQQFTFFTKCKSLDIELDMKFAFYYFFVIDEWCKSNLNVSSFPSVDMAKLKKLAFPIPPLSEQRRIVEILDRFDALCTDLTDGLPAEIAARKKQYERYRDRLLTFAPLPRG